MTAYGERLLARLGESGSTLATDPQLEQLLDGLFDRAEGRLPHRPIRRDAMVDRIADALLAADEPPDREALIRLNAPDLYLALALAAGDMRALEIAESELMPAVRQAVGRIDPNPSFVDEITQRVRERLLVGEETSPPAITVYRGTGPLSRWVRIIANRIALDLKQGEAGCGSEHESEATLAEMPAPSDPELEAIWHACADAYKEALAEAFASLPQRERNLLRQRYLDNLNMDALGRIYRVTPSTTDRWLQQIEERLAAATRAALVAKIEHGQAQAESVERLVATQLQLSLPRMLRSGIDPSESEDRRGY